MPDYALIGRLVRPHGVRGELVLEPAPAAESALETAETLYVGEPPQAVPLEGWRRHRDRLLIRLAGCDDRLAADAYRGQDVFVQAQAAAPLAPGTYYWRQILGLTVVTDAGERLGPITDILATGANDVYVVRSSGAELLIPAAPGVVLRVDLEAREMTVRLPPGLR